MFTVATNYGKKGFALEILMQEILISIQIIV